MVGRNDPCPCGSGKKHKRCCLGKNVVPIDHLVDEELDRIIHSFYDQDHSPSITDEFQRHIRKWSGKLGGLWDTESIQSAAGDHFFFVNRRDIWNRHVMKALNSSNRSGVRSVIETWQDPLVLFGKVTGEKNGFVEVEEILGDSLFLLEVEEGMPAEKNSVVFGIVLRDNRIHSNGLYVIISLMFMKDENGHFEKTVSSLAESSGFDNSYDFYKEHMVDIYSAMLLKESETFEEIVDANLTPIQLEALEMMNDNLLDMGVDEETHELMNNIAATYFLRENPGFRKPSVIAAAFFQAAIDIGILGNYYMTNVEIAKLFSVSTGSMTKHAENIGEYIFTMVDELEEEELVAPGVVSVIGTDPRSTERVNWEMFVKMSRKDFTAPTDINSHLEAAMNEEFKPKGNLEKAQLFVYKAYDAENDQDRYRFAEQAANLDNNNVDVLLLKAEIAEQDDGAEELYRTAINAGEMKFEEATENPWGYVTNRPYMRALFKYGVWLYERERFSEASQLFNHLLELNPEDNQGARYLAIASSIHQENFDKACEILDDYEETSEHDAIHLFLSWYLEASMTEGESEDSAWMFAEADSENPFVEAIIESNPPQLPFPRNLELVPGRMEEAMFIWKLLK